MPDKELQRLRSLRFQADQMLRTLVDDLKPFRAADEKLGFRRTPTSTPKSGLENDVNVTTTCSCLMALAMFGKLEKFYGPKYQSIVTEILQNVIRAPWKSSGLTENNAFTTTLVLRCYGFLREAQCAPGPETLPPKAWDLAKEDAKVKISESEPTAEVLVPGMTLEEVARRLAEKIGNFSINTYPPASAVVYWFVDGVDRAGFDLKSGWSTLCHFAGNEFRRQRSLVTAQHTAMMDPVAMAMAACLCARLHRVKKLKEAHSGCSARELPSMIELESSITELFVTQTPSGLWPKYFPLFHYNEAGSNFCYTFELLEAVLLEFGSAENSTLASESVLEGLERAVISCEYGRLETMGPEYGAGNSVLYCGWNSGGNLKTLQEAQPESWATAVVHMFLRELSDQVSEHVRERLLMAYSAGSDESRFKRFNELLDIKVKIDDSEQLLSSVLQDELVQTFSKFRGSQAKSLLRQPAPGGRLSALLFGPPGTSKTQVAKAIAAELQWPLVEIDPSRFLRKTFQNLYVEAEEIFNDVMDLYGVVVLFDELDALVQKRGGDTQDTESTFLTTYMLPKLAKLHDASRSVFLMATNFEERFDEAIKRAGRFDLLLCMGPPTLDSKCDKLSIVLGVGKEIEEGGKLLLQYAKASQEVFDQLTLYTFGEFKSFVKRLGNADTIHTELEKLGAEAFHSRVKQDAKSVGLRLTDLNLLKDSDYHSLYTPSPWKQLSDLYSADLQEAEILNKMKSAPTPAVRYILERKRSKTQ